MPGAGPSAPSGDRVPAALYERDAELATLNRVLDAARRGVGSMVIIEGPAGIGKTALLDRARRVARSAESGAPVRVLTARASPLEQDMAHGVIRQLLEPTVRAAGEQVRAGLLAGSAALARPVVLPEHDDDLDAIGDRRAPVLHGLFWLTTNLASDGPVLLAIDDLHWADAASLRFLAYLAMRLDGLPVAVIATVRSGEIVADETVLAELSAAPSTTLIRPEALTSGAVGQLLEIAQPGRFDPELAAACRDATGGVPFLLDALLGALTRASTMPTAATVGRITSATVGHATLLRLSRLGPAATPVARAVAVLGRQATSTRVARVADLDETVVLRSADALAAADILGTTRPFAFVHPIVAASVYDAIPAGQRALAHAAAARLLAQDGEPAESVAAHLLVAEPGSVAGAAGTLRQAAALALARGAPESAVSYLRRCLTEPDHRADGAAVLHQLARAEAMVGDHAAVGHFVAARAEAIDPEDSTAISLDLVQTLMAAGQWDEALTAVNDALDAAGGLGRSDELAGRLEVFRAGMMSNDPRWVDAFEQDLPRLEGLAGKPGRAGALMAALLASCAICRGAPAERVLGLVARGLADPGLLTGTDADAWGPQVAASLSYLTEFDRALAAVEEMRTAARERGSVYGFVRAAAVRALVADLRGDLPAVEADLRSAFELSRTHRLMYSVPPLLRWSLDALVERPSLIDITETVAGIELEPVLAESFSGGWLLEVRGRLRLSSGDLGGAATDLTRAGRIMSSLHVTNPMITAWRSGLALALARADPRQARRLAAEELEVCPETGPARGAALRTAGLVSTGEDRETLLRQSLAALESATAPLEIARTQVDLGATLRRAGRRGPAADLLRPALDAAHRCGAERLAGRAEEQLRALGARPRRRALTGPESLTPSEARVAAAAAGGMSNREIAQALFVTAKTVENQLGRCYAKLGIRGRDELPAAMAEAEQPV